MATEKYIYVFSSHKNNGDKSTVERHGLASGGIFELVHIHKKEILFGSSFFTIPWVRQIYILKSNNPNILSFNLMTNSILKTKIQLEQKDSFQYIHEGV